MQAFGPYTSQTNPHFSHQYGQEEFDFSLQPTDSGLCSIVARVTNLIPQFPGGEEKPVGGGMSRNELQDRFRLGTPSSGKSESKEGHVFKTIILSDNEISKNVTVGSFNETKFYFEFIKEHAKAYETAGDNLFIRVEKVPADSSNNIPESFFKSDSLYERFNFSIRDNDDGTYSIVANISHFIPSNEGKDLSNGKWQAGSVFTEIVQKSEGKHILLKGDFEAMKHNFEFLKKHAKITGFILNTLYIGANK